MRMRHSIMLLSSALIIACSVSVASESNLVERALVQTRDDVAAATDELSGLRDKIAVERLPLSQQIETLTQDVVRLRRQAEEERAARRMRGDRLSDLKTEVARLEDESEFINTALLEYRRTLETYAGVAETAQLKERLGKFDAEYGAKSSKARPMFDYLQPLLDLAADWTEQGFRGRVFEGACLDQSGRELDGLFAVIGPLQYFSSSAGSGLVVMRSGSPAPALFSRLSDAELGAIDQLASTGEATVPVDASGGNALKTRQSRKSMLERFQEGGFTMYPLLAIGLLSIVLALGKFMSLAKVATEDRDGIEKVARALRGGDGEGARAAADQICRPLRQIVMEGIRHSSATRELVEEMMHERVMTIVPRLQRNLGTLAVFGAVAPLLGLLGTVTGMIHTFQLVTIFGTGDAKMLSGGISEALITTETGLAIAIPVLLIHAYLSRRVGRMTGELEHSVVEFVSTLKGQEEEGCDGDS